VACFKVISPSLERVRIVGPPSGRWFELATCGTRSGVYLTEKNGAIWLWSLT
jgi:hypothetical protein